MADSSDLELTGVDLDELESRLSAMTPERTATVSGATSIFLGSEAAECAHKHVTLTHFRSSRNSTRS